MSEYPMLLNDPTAGLPAPNDHELLAADFRKVRCEIKRLREENASLVSQLIDTQQERDQARDAARAFARERNALIDRVSYLEAERDSLLDQYEDLKSLLAFASERYDG